MGYTSSRRIYRLRINVLPNSNGLTIREKIIKA